MVEEIFRGAEPFLRHIHITGTLLGKHLSEPNHITVSICERTVYAHNQNQTFFKVQSAKLILFWGLRACNLIMFLQRPKPHNDETLESFLIRVANKNGYEDVHCFCNDLVYY
ncbi:hypothetical protein BCT71_05365 [Vibrio sp. 10N.261.51.A7]|jgi:hypothetical protein|nr:hypothetical protein A140_08945 [Vibrio crassostreae 9ZC88]PML74609.1 hypothetical protein BCT71_05365 [Vibrio sp. 10N.261.51.A7]